MDGRIPVSFEYEGIWFEGFFSNGNGVGFNYYALKLNGIGYGLLKRENTGWKWLSGPQKLFEEPYMLQYFISVVAPKEREDQHKH